MASCAVIDDYQNVAAGRADWSHIGDKVEVTFFARFESALRVDQTMNRVSYPPGQMPGRNDDKMAANIMSPSS